MKFTKREIISGEASGRFIRLKDGESKVGVFRGEVFEFFQKWENGRSQVVDAGTPEAKSRFRLNFVTKEDGELKAKVFEFGLTIYNQLADLAEDYDLEQTAVKISRRGTGTDTVYTIFPAKDQPTQSQWKSIDAIELIVLEHKDANGKPKNYAPGAEDDEGLNF